MYEHVDLRRIEKNWPISILPLSAAFVLVPASTPAAGAAAAAAAGAGAGFMPPPAEGIRSLRTEMLFLAWLAAWLWDAGAACWGGWAFWKEKKNKFVSSSGCSSSLGSICVCGRNMWQDWRSLLHTGSNYCICRGKAQICTPNACLLRIWHDITDWRSRQSKKASIRSHCLLIPLTSEYLY